MANSEYKKSLLLKQLENLRLLNVKTSTTVQMHCGISTAARRLYLLGMAVVLFCIMKIVGWFLFLCNFRWMDLEILLIKFLFINVKFPDFFFFGHLTFNVRSMYSFCFVKPQAAVLRVLGYSFTRTGGQLSIYSTPSVAVNKCYFIAAAKDT